MLFVIPGSMHDKHFPCGQRGIRSREGCGEERGIMRLPPLGSNLLLLPVDDFNIL